MKHGRKSATLLHLGLAALLLLAVSCEQGESDPARRVVMRAVKKMGGLEKLRGWETRIERGTMTRENPGWGTLNAKVVSWVKKPDKLKLDQDYSAYNHPFYYVYYLNGEDAWMVVNMQERVHPSVTTNLQDYMKDVDGLGHYVADADTLVIVPDVPDDSLLAGTSIDRVRYIGGEDTVMLDFDRESGMLRRVVEDGGARIALYDDYRETGGRTLPFHVKLYNRGALESEYRWESMEFDVPIDDAVFEESRPAPRPVLEEKAPEQEKQSAEQEKQSKS